MRQLWLVGCLSVVVLAGTVRIAQAAPTAEQRKQASQVQAAVKKANRLLEANKARDAAATVSDAIEQVTKLVGDGATADIARLLEPVMGPLGEVHASLELEGLKLPPLPKIEVKEAPKPAAKPGAPAAPGETSFSKQVATVLVTRCGRCHVDDSKGKVSMLTYDALMKGSPEDGPIILEGNSKGSRIMEVIESGAMPKGGGKLRDTELAVLAKWIDEGAKNDAKSGKEAIRELAMAVANATPPPPVVKATGKESVHFGLELAPVLVKSCNGCHGAERPRARLSFTSFTSLLKGSEGGPVIEPGKPEESMLIKKIKGLAGARMPQGGPPLSDEVIAKFETWIREGATFDGPDPQVSLARVAAVLRAQNSTPEELSADRADLAAAHWRKANPDDEANRVETKNFLLLGNVGEATLNQIAEAAESQVERVAQSLKLPVDDGVLKGRLTIYVFASRTDYSEFGTMVEERSLPKSWRGHWQYDIVDPYICVMRPGNEKYSLDVMLAQQIASIFVAKHGGGAPHWLAEGAGRAIASRLDGKDVRILAWEEQIPLAGSRMNKADDFLTGKLPPEDADALSYGFVRSLMGKSSNFNALLKALDSGATIDQALAKAYGSSATQLATVWATTKSKKR